MRLSATWSACGMVCLVSVRHGQLVAWSCDMISVVRCALWDSLLSNYILEMILLKSPAVRGDQWSSNLSLLFWQIIYVSIICRDRWIEKLGRDPLRIRLLQISLRIFTENFRISNYLELSRGSLRSFKLRTIRKVNLCPMPLGHGRWTENDRSWSGMLGQLTLLTWQWIWCGIREFKNLAIKLGLFGWQFISTWIFLLEIFEYKKG